MARTSAGILLHRGTVGAPEVLIGHPGGPLWSRRDAGAWTVPKGEPEAGESLLAAARREFTEELGLPVPPGEPVGLGSVRQAGGKVVTVWALRGDLDPDDVVPGTFTMTWPPRSGRTVELPELDRVAWCDPVTARERLLPAQTAFLDRLLALLA